MQTGSHSAHLHTRLSQQHCMGPQTRRLSELHRHSPKRKEPTLPAEQTPERQPRSATPYRQSFDKKSISSGNTQPCEKVTCKVKLSKLREHALRSIAPSVPNTHDQGSTLNHSLPIYYGPSLRLQLCGVRSRSTSARVRTLIVTKPTLGPTTVNTVDDREAMDFGPHRGRSKRPPRSSPACDSSAERAGFCVDQRRVHVWDLSTDLTVRHRICSAIEILDEARIANLTIVHKAKSPTDE